MNTGFFVKLAKDGIRKNKRMYFPYILTGVIMVMMFYILSSLMENPSLEEVQGGSVLMTVLPLGAFVIGIFSVIFLVYTNSFLLKQRYREFALYNILGMDKRNIAGLMLWETIFTAAIAIFGGLVCGIALSKAAELILLNLLNMEVGFRLSIGMISLRNTVLLYIGIYVGLLVNSLIRVCRSKPLELMLNSKAGEKIPKFLWIFGTVGVGLLACAYYLSVTIQEPATAFFMFFIAVLMVILGTYLVFMYASVAFCRLLQKNKRYYYKPNHFISVSSMAYRMKRNGAGLASICILLTMVLVMLSSTATLYFGNEGAVKNRYPSDLNIKICYNTIDGISNSNISMLKRKIEKYAPKDAELIGTRYGAVPGLFTEQGIIVDYNNAPGITELDYDNVGYLFIISTEDYNRMMKEEKTLGDEECFIYSKRLTTKWDTFSLENGADYKVKEFLGEFREDGDALAMTMPSVYLVVNDIASFVKPIANLRVDGADSKPLLEYQWLCGIDYDDKEKEVQASQDVFEEIKKIEEGSGRTNMYYVESREVQRQGFFELYGSLFFLGIMLSVVFLLAAVLIIYYKQISEGYEDADRFEIMKKVGMTKRNIKKNINSQMLTVFFMPIVFAGIHLAFAFPFISKILVMFCFDDTVLNVVVMLICYAVFAFFYALVYKVTSGSYYAIVSQRK